MTGVPAEPRRRRLLYIHPDTMGFSTDLQRNRLHFLSRYFEGDFLAIWKVHDRSEAEGVELARELNRLTRISFRYTYSYHLPVVVRQLWDVAFFVSTGLRLSLRAGRYDAIVAYGPYRTGIAAYILKVLTRTPLILELPGNPRKTFDFGGGAWTRIKRLLAPRLVSFLVKRADHLWLRYPGQVPGLGEADQSRVSIFPNFVPINTVRVGVPGEKYILFLGFPWDLKGVDLLILAWNRLWRRFPDWHVKIIGHCPDRSPYIALQGDNTAIEFGYPVPHPKAMELMERCSIFVLPSRTDAMARVLIEAMAAGKPIIASRVDGTPHYLEHGRTALLFESENVDELTAHLETFLQSPAMASGMGEAAHAYAHAELSEVRYAERFRDMVEQTISTRAAARRGARSSASAERPSSSPGAAVAARRPR